MARYVVDALVCRVNPLLILDWHVLIRNLRSLLPLSYLVLLFIHFCHFIYLILSRNLAHIPNPTQIGSLFHYVQGRLLYHEDDPLVIHVSSKTRMPMILPDRLVICMRLSYSYRHRSCFGQHFCIPFPICISLTFIVTLIFV